MSNNRSKRNNYSSKHRETNPIINQLKEFGYSSVYSRRVFHYLHPEDLEEALNYMAIDDGIIQHRFVRNRHSLKINVIYVEKQEIFILKNPI